MQIVVELEADGVPVAGFPYTYTGSMEVAGEEQITNTLTGSFNAIAEGDAFQPLRALVLTVDKAFSVRLGNQSDGTDVSINANGIYVLAGAKVIGATSVAALKFAAQPGAIRAFMAGEYIL